MLYSGFVCNYEWDLFISVSLFWCIMLNEGYDDYSICKIVSEGRFLIFWDDIDVFL